MRKILEGVSYEINGKLHVFAGNKLIITASAPLKKRRRKEQVGPVKQLLPAPLPKNMAGFGKCWIGDTLYYIGGTNEILIPKAAVEEMLRLRRRKS